MAGIEIKEGFLCPMCMQDLGTVAQLTAHFEEQHSNEDKDVINQLKGFFDKAKKKILKKEREDEVGAVPYVQEKPVPAAARVSGTDPTLWEPQTLGTCRSHTDLLKKVRDTRIDRFVIETNKLLIRLDKLISPDAPSEPGKRKAYEKTVVPWAHDSDVQLCITCGKRFNLSRRRHHCRLCGGIMCNSCSQFLPLDYAKKLTNPAYHYEGEGFRRSNSNSSLNSMFTPEGEMQTRTCEQCRTLLERRDQQMEQRNSKPLLIQLYEKMKGYISETDRLLPYFLKMTDALNNGESTYSLEDAQMLRMKVMKLYENVDSISKRILKLGLDHAESPSQKQLQLQRMIRVYANGYLQDNLLGLQSLPTAEQYEKIKERKKEEIQRKIELEKQAVIERARRLEQKEYEVPAVETEKTHQRKGSRGFVQDQGWKPSEATHGNSDDPMVQQMNIISGYIRQAKQADRWDEAQMLEENLKDLQKEYWRQQQSSMAKPDEAARQRLQEQQNAAALAAKYTAQSNDMEPVQRPYVMEQQTKQQSSSQSNLSHEAGGHQMKPTPPPPSQSSVPKKSSNPFDDDYEDVESKQLVKKSMNPFDNI